MGSVNTLVEGLIEGLYMVLSTNYLVYQGFSIDSRNLFLLVTFTYIYHAVSSSTPISFTSNVSYVDWTTAPRQTSPLERGMVYDIVLTTLFDSSG